MWLCAAGRVAGGAVGPQPYPAADRGLLHHQTLESEGRAGVPWESRAPATYMHVEGSSHSSVWAQASVTPAATDATGPPILPPPQVLLSQVSSSEGVLILVVSKMTNYWLLIDLLENLLL